jgi:hypothetical protein
MKIKSKSNFSNENSWIGMMGCRGEGWKKQNG